jgi:hypothetical protein
MTNTVQPVTLRLMDARHCIEKQAVFVGENNNLAKTGMEGVGSVTVRGNHDGGSGDDPASCYDCDHKSHCGRQSSLKQVFQPIPK